MITLRKKLFVYLTLLGIFFTGSFFVNQSSVKGATPTPTATQRVIPTPTRRRAPTPTRRLNITYFIDKVSDASEQGPQAGQFKVWLTVTGTPEPMGWSKVYYTISGTATNGTDYQTIQNYLYVPFMATGGPTPTDAPITYITINPIADNLVEGTETVTITLTGVNVGAGRGTATLNITDLVSTPTPTATPTPTRRATPTPTGGVILNPTIPPGVTITYYVSSATEVPEPSSSMFTMTSFKFWSTQTGPVTSNGYFEVKYTVGGTATNGTDYTVPNPLYGGLPGKIWVKVGNPSPPPLPTDTFIDTATIMVRKDTLVEGTETVIVTLTGVNVGPGQGSTTLKILDANVAATPTVTPIPSPTATPTTTLPGGVTQPPTPPQTGYAVSYVIQSDWGTGATVNVTITNNSTSAVNGWTLAYTFPGNQTITNLWNGTCTQSGASVSVTNSGSNALIGANGGSVNFGFNLNYSGVNAKPTAFTLNGTTCRVQ